MRIEVGGNHQPHKSVSFGTARPRSLVIVMFFS